jgi:trans-aconitate 2-methyltransferase
MSASPWSPDQYERFKDERTQPFHDLLAMVRPCPGGRAVDLGCGTGELTRSVHLAAQTAETVGIDSSETMLARSGGFAAPGLRFELGDVAQFAPAKPFDLVFSNAALQWVPGHEGLFERLAAAVAPGGQIAIQMPDNDGYPSHEVAKAVAREEPFASAMGGYERSWPVQAPEWYAVLLERLGFREQRVVLNVYGHYLESRDGVVEWVKGTYLTEYQKRLSPALYERYVERYREALAEVFEDRQPFFYPYRRILMWARR